MSEDRLMTGKIFHQFQPDHIVDLPYRDLGAENIDIYNIKPFPTLEVVQLPSIFVSVAKLTQKFRDSEVSFYHEQKISLEEFKEAVTLYGFKNLILLKWSRAYLLADIHLSDLMNLANQVYRTSKLKAFW